MRDWDPVGTVTRSLLYKRKAPKEESLYMEHICPFCKRTSTPENSQQIKKPDGTTTYPHKLCLRLQRRIDNYYDAKAKRKTHAMNNR
jgi:phage FluMu protein Com